MINKYGKMFSETRIQPLPSASKALFPIDKASWVARANEVQKTLSGELSQVEQIVGDHDIVFAIWQDHEEADGVGSHPCEGPTSPHGDRCDREQQELQLEGAAMLVRRTCCRIAATLRRA